MAFDREAAKADGYTDEEIDQYLATKDQPLPPEQPRDRSEEQLGTAQAVGTGALTAVAPYALGVPAAAVGYKMYSAANNATDAAKALADAKMASEQGIAQRAAARGLTPPPAAPAVPTQAPVQTAPVQTTPTAPAQAPQMQAAKSIVQKLALDKILKGAGVAGAVYGLGQGLFGTSPEEIATLKAAEARRKQLGQ